MVQYLVSDFLCWNITKIPKSKDLEADRLSRYVSIVIPNPDDSKERIFVKYLSEKTTSTAHLEMLNLHEEASRPSWIDPILNYLRDGIFPIDRKEARSIIYKAANYTIIDGTLYKRGFSFLLLRCLRLEEGLKVLEDLHVGERSNHVEA